jgi:hypothetical protein
MVHMSKGENMSEHTEGTKSHQLSAARRRQWIDCPLCGSTDTRAEPEGEDGWLIYCVNLLCPSNVPKEAPVAASRPWCGHSKMVHGCPACAFRWLKHRGIVSVQPFTGNVVGLKCFRGLRK